MTKQFTPIGILWICLFSLNLSGQDIHHSQFYTSPLNVNPALTGVFNGDNRYTANARSQWFVDELVKYLTFTGSFDKRFYPKRWDKKGMWNGGILFNFDQAGDSKLGFGHLGISGSYAYPITRNNIISLGAMVGGTQRSFNQNALRWGEQYNPLDPKHPNLNQLTEDLSNRSNAFLDISSGINYRWQKSKRTKVDFGVSAYHLNQPKQEFFKQSSSTKLPIRFNLNLTPSIAILHNLDILLHAQYQNQKPYQETVIGGYAKWYVSNQAYKQLALLFGLAARIKDAAYIPKFAVEYNQWNLGLSYDINTSPWKIATRQRGGPELSLIYIMTKSRPLEQLKACPIF